MSDFNDVLREAIDARISEVHVALPARVESYDPATQKASVTPLLKKKLRSGAEFSLGVIDGVPVIMPRSSLGSLTFPISRGDTVLLVFAERAIDNWLSLGGEQPPGDPRKYDLSDAIAIPGLFPFNVPGKGSSSKVLLECNNAAKLSLSKDSKVALGAGTVEVLDIISQMLQAISVATTVSTSDSLTCSAALVALKVQIDSIKGTL